MTSWRDVQLNRPGSLKEDQTGESDKILSQVLFHYHDYNTTIFIKVFYEELVHFKKYANCMIQGCTHKGWHVLIVTLDVLMYVS